MAFFERFVDFSNDSVKLECFRFFDLNEKQYLDASDFTRLIECLLNHNSATLTESIANDLFVSFDLDADKKINEHEFENVWHNWIKPLIQPVTSFLIIDVQNDFIDGSLALKNCPAKQDGSEIVPLINELINDIKFDVLAYSLDQHPADHISFFENFQLHKLSEDNKKNGEDFKLFDTVSFHGPPQFKQILWPTHCVAGTWGEQFHPNLKVPEGSIIIHKGTDPKIDSYSAFRDNIKSSITELHQRLQERQVTHVFVCGLAYDHCVYSTALDALDLGYATVVIEDACRGTDVESIKRVQNILKSNNCVLAKLPEIEKFVNGKDIRIEFAMTLAKLNQRNSLIM
ncbi:hypothetical protein CDAR_56711 [Caerostris darwini]|uniref:nicotinamidase n=1 Tax=Caerostris darwini TaxID=1538125 RepID=A0AAV4PWN2_9ARAC|nr:hypothetical protein CDAR_56711 [Caerostris darwini]